MEYTFRKHWLDYMDSRGTTSQYVPKNTDKLISYLLEPIVSRMKADGDECICV